MTVGCSTIDLELLRKGFNELNIDSTAYEAAFVEYFNLLQKWNRVYNLTAISEPREIVIKHFFDSLSIRPYLLGNHIIDIGTGAGFPGIPLAIVEPKRQFVLLDSQIKKTHFLTVVKSALGLSQVEIVHSRVEDYLFDGIFDTVISRAFASLTLIREKTQRLLVEEGQILVMKGQYPVDELANLDANSIAVEVHPLNVPYLAQKRHLVCMPRTDKF